jgi:hypothetical protein
MLRIPHSLHNRLTDGGKILSPRYRPCSNPQKQYYFSASGTRFCYRLNEPQGLAQPERLVYIFNNPDTNPYTVYSYLSRDDILVLWTATLCVLYGLLYNKGNNSVLKTNTEFNSERWESAIHYNPQDDNLNLSVLFNFCHIIESKIQQTGYELRRVGKRFFSSVFRGCEGLRYNGSNRKNHKKCSRYTINCLL